MTDKQSKLGKNSIVDGGEDGGDGVGDGGGDRVEGVVLVDGKVVGDAVLDVDDDGVEIIDEDERGDVRGPSTKLVGGELRAKALAEDARIKDKAADVAEASAQKNKDARASISADKSGKTKWAKTAQRIRDDSIWHGFSCVGAYVTVSYCGIQYLGTKRSGAPPRGDVVCEKCAQACGFTRRSARMIHGRQRGSRRLGSIADRLEETQDRLETVAERMEKVLEGEGE